MISYLWQLPQHLLALVVLMFYKPTRVEKYSWAKVYWLPVDWGISLGQYILVCDEEQGDLNLVRHEFGHSLQSRMLGPLYLLVVGLPSILMNLASRRFPKFGERYYDRWPESWADRLGHVERE